MREAYFLKGLAQAIAIPNSYCTGRLLFFFVLSRKVA